jgi:hypothetical protein
MSASRPMTPPERSCLFIASNCIARAALRAPTRTKMADALTDLDRACTQAHDLLRCLRVHARRNKS